MSTGFLIQFKIIYVSKYYQLRDVTKITVCSNVVKELFIREWNTTGPVTILKLAAHLYLIQTQYNRKYIQQICQTLIQTIENFLPNFVGLNYYFYYQAHLCDDRSFEINYFEENVSSRRTHDILVSLQACLFFVWYIIFFHRDYFRIENQLMMYYRVQIYSKKVFKYSWNLESVKTFNRYINKSEFSYRNFKTNKTCFVF